MQEGMRKKVVGVILNFKEGSFITDPCCNSTDEHQHLHYECLPRWTQKCLSFFVKLKTVFSGNNIPKA